MKEKNEGKDVKMARDVEKALEDYKKIVNNRYACGFDEMDFIKDSSGDLFIILLNSFRYGYVMGHRAAEAEVKCAGKIAKVKKGGVSA